MANTSYDTLTIKIEADSKEATTNIKKLSTSLQKLDKTAKELNTRRIGEVKGLLLNIAKIDFSNVSKGLQDVVSAFRYFQNIDKIQKSLNKVAEKPAKQPKTKSDFALAKEGQKAKIEDLNSTLVKLGLTLGQIDTLSNGLKNRFDPIPKDKQEEIRNTLVKLGYNIKDVNKALKETEKTAKKSKGMQTFFNKLNAQFKSLLRNRILRKLIQEIYKMFQQGVQNVIAFDSATAQSYNKIRDSFQYLSDSLGAMLAPLIQFFEPFITMLTDTVGDLANSFGQLFAEINGQNGYAKAIKGEKNWASAMKKTQSIGIDELNVLSRNGNFVNAETENSFSSIKEAFSTILSTAKDFVSNVLPKIKKVLEPVMKIVSKIFDLVDQLVKETFQDVHDSIGEFVEMIAKILDFVANLVESLMPSLRQIISQISVFINVINSVLSVIFYMVGDLFKILKPAVTLIGSFLLPALNVVLTILTTIGYVVEAIIKTIRDFFTLNWSKIGDDWKEMANKVGEAWKSMATGNAELFAKLGVETYATGGFPEDGLFMANHGELVGQFSNGQTAVANNEQITEGIYQAVLNAMRESGGSQNDIVINLDGYEIARVVQKQQNNFGYQTIRGGVVNYGK